MAKINKDFWRGIECGLGIAVAIADEQSVKLFRKLRDDEAKAVRSLRLMLDERRQIEAMKLSPTPPASRETGENK